MGIIRKSVVLSLAGHVAAFTIFNFSFGNKMPQAQYSGVSFYGAYLRPNQVLPASGAHLAQGIKKMFFYFPRALPLPKVNPKTDKEYALELSGYHLKPAGQLSGFTQKEEFSAKPLTPPPVPRPQRQSSIIFHPTLPYSFILYFKDRQVAHVELLFNAGSPGSKKAIEVKRKISSGNLEADLLIGRYISHYLFIQQANLAPQGGWQAVKIDLSAKND